MKRRIRRTWRRKTAALAAAFMAMSFGGITHAMPQDGTIRSGEGNITRPDDKTMTIDQKTDRLAIDWKGFDVQNGEKVNFNQPDARAIALNRVTGDAKSVIDGQLTANGRVYVINPNGVLFGKNASVDVGSLVASTANVSDDTMKNFAGSKDPLTLTLGGDSTAQVINEGTIKAQGGLVALHAASVANDGTIANEGGKVALAAAKNITLSEDTAGKINFTVDGALAKASTLNSGVLSADGGYVVMTAKQAGDVMSTVVNNTGTIEAKTLRQNEKGEILLDGGDNGVVEVSGTIDASGLENNQSAGSIKVIGNTTTVHDGTNLLARGTLDGGKIETSGDVLNLGSNLNIDAKGINGNRGEWLLDPLEILIQDDQPTQDSLDQTVSTVNGGSETQINYNDPPSATQNANATYDSTSWIKTSLITDILAKGTDVTIQAASTSQAASITVNSAITPTIGGDGEATLELDAQRNITINKEIKADASGGKLNVKLNSDTDGDGVGAVIINADISTNGGTFTSGSGGNVVYDATVKDAKGNTVYQNVTNAQTGEKVPQYKTAGYITDGVLSGSPKIDGNTVGTYFGYATPTGSTVIGTKEDRIVSTNGGDINLYGEVAIGLNGGTLTLDTSKTDGTNGGNLNITGIVNSGNSYDDYIYGTEAWDNLVSTLVQEYLDAGTVPAYHYVGINYKKNADGTYSYTTEPVSYARGTSHYAFHEFSSGDVKGKNWTYPTTDDSLDTFATRWYTTTVAGSGYNSFLIEGTTPTTSKMSIDDWLIYYRRTEPDNYAAKYANGDTNTTTNLVTYNDIKNDATKMETLKSDISALIAHNWYASEALAKSGTGANAGDSYLATITTALENSLSTPNSQKTLWVGGMGSGVRNKTNDTTNNPYSQYPSDPRHQDGFYWVTGPEGLVINEDGTTGTKFWDTSSSNWSNGNYGSQVYGYTKWSSWSGGGQPDNSAPFLTVGYGNNNAWDDAAIGGDTTVGFVQETNLYNSSLNIKTAGGSVTLQGDIGKSVALDTVKIDAGTGDVITGNTTNTATTYNHGTIYSDHGVYINGKDVSVGGEIHSGGTDVEATRNTDASFSDYLDNVTIQSSNNLTVHGIEVNASTDPDDNATSRTDGDGGKIKLTSTGTNGVITLGDGVDYNGKNTNGGVLKAASTANDAVVIDAQGTAGGFKNLTSVTATPAISTSGAWKIYSASPEYDDFGNNLDSKTDAQWSAASEANLLTQGDKPQISILYATTTAKDTGASGKYIFQTTPTITVSADDYTKVYGDTFGTNTTTPQANEELTPENMHNDLDYREEYTKSDGTTTVDVSSFTNAFQEKDLKSYIDGKVTVSSRGSAADATRTNGDIADTDKNKSIYNVNVNIDAVKGLNGHLLKKENGTLIITPKALTVSGTGEQTYGNSTITKWSDTTTGTLFGAKVSYDNLTGKTPTIKAGSSYDTNRTTNHPHGSTADASDTVYQDALDSSNFSNIKISDAAGNDMSANYTVTTSGDLKVNKADITLNLNDVKTTYGKAFDTNEYGYDHNNIPVLNGDDVSVITDNLQNKDLKYTNTGDGINGRTTQDAVSDYKLKADDTSLDNYNIHFNDGDSVIEKAKLSITTPDITTEYGTVKPGSGSSLTGLTNGDENDTTGLVYDYTYGNGYLDNNTRTNNLGDYTVTTDVSGKDYLKNYEITPGKSNLHIDPKDVYIRVDGNGHTTQDITYVDPDIDSKLSYGDHATWTPNLGGQTGEFTYDVITDINGHSFKPGESDVIGNYRFHYDGEAVVSPSKPDIDPPVVPPVVPGNGGYTPPTNPQTPSEQESGTVEKDWGTRDEGPGVDRERHIIKVQLPFFKIDDGKMTNYGTYDVKSQAAKVEISPTGKRLPEPNQPKTQYREYTKDITTDDGTGEFRLIYNGSTFHVMPLDDAARTMMQTGDEKHNVDLFAKALHIGFSEMGILPADLDGVYANFQDIAADAQNNSK